MPPPPPAPLRHLLCVLFYLVGAAVAEAREGQAFLNRFWQTSEGMPSNVVSAVERDADGFLWIATGAGVTRFDGARFEVFTGRDGLPDTQISALHIDRRGRIWAGTRRGVARRENGVWAVPKGLPAETVFALGEAGDGSMWMGTYTGCWRWVAGEAGEITLDGVEPDTRALLDDGAGGMWILTQGHLCRWRPDFKNAARLVSGPWDGQDLRGLARDEKGRLIVCGTGLLWRQKGDGWEDLAETMPRGRESANLACAAAPDGTLWVATRNRGLLFLDESGWGSVDATKDLSLDDVRGLLIDSEGLVWAGTNGGGLNRLRPRLFDTYSNNEGLRRTVTSALVADRAGAVWAGTDGSGVFLYKDGSFSAVPHALSLPGDGLIWSLCATKDGSLWIGTYKNGLIRVREGKVERVPTSQELSQNAISALQESRDGGLLIGTHHEGLLKWKEGKVEPVFIGPEGSKTVIHGLMETRAGDLWVAAAGSGLWRWHEGAWVKINKELGMPGLISTALLEAANGDVWIGSLGQGLVRYRDGHLTAWSREDGLMSVTVVQLLEDETGDLWLGTDTGLQRVSPAALPGDRERGRAAKIGGLRLSREDGLPTPQFSGEHGNLAVRTPDGALWFSQASGVIRVNPRAFAEPAMRPVVRIQSAAADKGELWNYEGPRARKGIVLEPGAGTLQIRFTSPGFVAPERVRFKYRMAGLESEWQETAGARTANYASLPPGAYQFEVVDATHDGTWTPNPVTIGVLVKAFFWQTLTFRVAVLAASVLALAYLVWAWSLRRIRRRMALLEQERRVDKERARIAQDLHDELGASLTEINFLGTLAADSVAESPARKKMEGIVERAQRMAKSLDEIVWTVNPANDTLSSTANYLCSRAQESLRAADIRCRLEVADHLPGITLDSELRHHLLMAVNEAVNNVMKHSGARDCTLSLEMERGNLIVCVQDGGSGFDATHLPAGRNGLTNLRRRMAALGGECVIESAPERGTRIRLAVPLAAKREA